MKAILYVFLDVTIYVVQGLLLVMLLKAAQARFQFKKLYANHVILLMQYVAIQMILHYSNMVKSILYGNRMIMNNSRQSIIPVLVSMLITLAVSMLLLKEERLKIVYYVVTFYSVIELLKFAFNPSFLWIFEKLMDWNQYLCVDHLMYGEKMYYAT